MVKSKDSIGAFGRDDGYSILPGRSFEAFDDSPFEKHTLDRILHCKLSERRRHGAVTSWDAIFSPWQWMRAVYEDFTREKYKTILYCPQDIRGGLVGR